MNEKLAFYEYDLTVSDEQYQKLCMYLCTIDYKYRINKDYSMLHSLDKPGKITHKVHVKDMGLRVFGIVLEMAKELDYKDRITVRFTENSDFPGRSFWVDLQHVREYFIPMDVFRYMSGIPPREYPDKSQNDRTYKIYRKRVA